MMLQMAVLVPAVMSLLLLLLERCTGTAASQWVIAVAVAGRLAALLGWRVRQCRQVVIQKLSRMLMQRWPKMQQQQQVGCSGGQVLGLRHARVHAEA
jgi:hypothetical protein